MLDVGGVALNDGSRALWLMLRNDAGWWSAAQLTHYWRPTFSIREVEAHLQTLQKGRFLERLRINVNTFAYAVTPACLPLPGLQLTFKPSSTTTPSTATSITTRSNASS